MNIDTDGVRQYDRIMLELLKGRPTERLVLTVTPQMKEAAVTMALDGEQTTSQLVRHLLAQEAARRTVQVEEAHASFEASRGERLATDG